jgi:predicted transposase YdaD
MKSLSEEVREEGVAQGVAQGVAIGERKAMANLVEFHQKNGKKFSTIAKILNISVDYVQELAATLTTDSGK